jgi:hypothetical protein
MLVGCSSKHMYSNISRDAEGVINDNYIIDVSEGPENAFIRETSFVCS